MSTPSTPFEIPRRLSLSVQAANSIRTAIHDGVWRDTFPSERKLCEIFQISRPTVRAALHILGKEGHLAIVPGRRNRVLTRPPSHSIPGSRLVGLVTHEPVSQMSFSSYQGISEMRVNLAEHGFATEILVCPAGSGAAQRRKLEEFFRHRQIFCCVLLSIGIELQKWFSEHSVPALVFGSCHPKIKLPSLDGDYRSVCRHAVGVFLSRGHRKMALIVPNSGAAGDLMSEQGFKEAALQATQHDEIRAVVIRHGSTAENLTTRLDTLFQSKDAPTALLVAKPQHVFVVMTYLLSRRLSVPGDVSLISRDDDSFFSPLISHYAFKGNVFIRRLSRLMMQLVNEGHLTPQPNLITPQYFAGTTVRSLNEGTE